ncbi:MAG: hypothetical protein OZ913_10015 [Ignavibacteriaceae bacterium]|nr:hypothetical protein [Ignavibacteriaceae bacterium]
MKTKTQLKLITLLQIILFVIACTGIVNAQTDAESIVKIIKDELVLNKGRTLAKSPGDILHIYSIDVPADVVIEEFEKTVTAYPVYVTMAYRSSNYKVEKYSEPYHVIMYKEPKNSLALLNPGDKKLKPFKKRETFWVVEEQSKAFKKTLDELPNLKENSLESIWGETDNFPSDWKK